jgi:hypothetical protein
MIKPEIRSAVVTMHQQSKGLRYITRALNISRNTVRRIVRQEIKKAQQEATPPDPQSQPVQPEHDLPDGMTEIFIRARGNVVRMQQLLQSELDQNIAYSTLTRWVRAAGLREAPERSGEYEWSPGEETQHDTSPHRFVVGGKAIVAQCASLVLAYSRKLYMQYYPRFTRLEPSTSYWKRPDSWMKHARGV